MLAGGAGALVEELAWFQQQAAARGLDLAAPPLPVTRDDAALLERLDAGPYPQAIAALWALERVYLLACRGTAGAPEPYAAFVEHWTAPGAGYVAALEQAAVDAWTPADDLRRCCAEVLTLEAAFWAAGT